MKAYITLCLFFLFTPSFSQPGFPDVYCNGEKVVNDQVSGYFTPLQFEFKFQSPDTSYVIREAQLLYVLNSSRDSMAFSSNKIYSDVLGVWDHIIISIKKVDVFMNKELVRTDSFPLSKKIKFIQLNFLSDKELQVINNNDVILYIDGAKFDENKPLTRQYKTFWQLALKKKGEEEEPDKTNAPQVKKWDLLLIRGNRPVFRLVSEGIGYDIRALWKYARRDDFIRLTIKVKGLPQRYLYKIIFIK